MIDVAALASLLAGERMHDTLLLAQLQRGRRHRYFLSTFDGPSSVEALVPRAGAATLRVEVLLTALEPLTVFLARRTELGPLLAGRVRQMAALVAIAVRTPLVVEARRSPPRGGSAARLTFDLFVDEELRPWLLGCTVAPAPSDTTGYEPILPERALLDEFPFPRWADVEAAGAGERPPAIRLEPDGVVSVDRDASGALLLIDRATGALATLDGEAADWWRTIERGAGPTDNLEWDARATWFEDRWVRRHGTPWPSEPEVDRKARAQLGVRGTVDGTRLRIGRADRERVPLPATIAEVAFVTEGEIERRQRLVPADGWRRFAAAARATPGLSVDAARALGAEIVSALAGATFGDETFVTDAQRARTRDRLATSLAYLCDRFAEAGLWHSLAYGTLLGALREQDIIAWDYDFDLLVRIDELPRILALGERLAADGYRLTPSRRSAANLAVNRAGVATFSTAAVDIHHHGKKIGDLYLFSVFSDGVMRRWDFDHDLYWCPHSSFPAYFVEEQTEVTLRGRRYPAVREPEKWIAGVYGEDWRIPYRAAMQGGQLRAGSTTHGDRYEPKLAAEVAWCRARGWDPSRYRAAPAWPPRRIQGGGPIGPTERTRDNTRSLWWTSLDELVRYF